MTAPTAITAVLRIPIDQVHPGPNARGDLGDVTELAASMRTLGQQIPAMVEQLAEGRYQLVDGHRRHAAALAAGLSHLDAVVRRPLPAGPERLVRQLAIETHARGFSPMAESRALHQLMFAHGLSRQEIAHRVGRTPAWVRDRIALVHLEPDEQAALERGRMSLAEASLRLRNRREMRDGRPPRPAVRATARHTTPVPSSASTSGTCPTCNRPL